MKKYLLLFTMTLIFGVTNIHSQTSCAELMEYVTSESYGTTYSSYSSDAISQVTFHEVTDNSYNTHYFAIVQFTSSYQKYLYQVGSQTKFNYSMDYLTSAGEAFWKYIQPYNENLNCAPDFN